VNAVIKDKSYQYKEIIPNSDCEWDMQATRTSFNAIKPGSAVDIKSFQKELEVKQRPVVESYLNSMMYSICLKSETDQQKLEAIKIQLDKISSDFEVSNNGIIHEFDEGNIRVFGISPK
jgi:hypothetical protein